MLSTLLATLRQPRMLLLLYGITLLLSLPVTLSLFGAINTETERSLAPLNLLNGFDYTVFSDFMNRHDGAIWPLLRAGWYSVLVYLITAIWTTGGVLNSFATGYRAVSFWQAGTYYFGRNARLFGVTLLFAIPLLVVAILIGSLLVIAVEDTLTERGIALIGFAVLAIFGLLLTLLLCVANYARVMLFRTDDAVAFRAFGIAGRFVLTNLRATFGPYLLIIAVGSALFGLYFLLEALLPTRNWFLILLLTLVQQAFIFGQIILKVWALRVAFEQVKR
ncbi:hypothetical protein J2I47_02230 [Fibrella sp. HMF5335]|uniref:Uncharacterized protein n=1 Tax=Fibrella rubiginis TaxID=2817060 RepID=A0A939GF22_9BACT|nr:hypothetical protein [Fibrella rubiginis]MBO0935357.1 hypothetical protein [Fibrella rubiginis]